MAGIVSFCFPHVADVSVLSICIILRAFVVVLSMVGVCEFGVESDSYYCWVDVRGKGVVVVYLSWCTVFCLVWCVLSGLRMRCLFVSLYVFPVVMVSCLFLLCLCSCVLMLR